MTKLAASASAGITTGCDRQIVLAGKIQVALVSGRAAEDGAGAVVHQHEIGDVDRNRPVRVKRVNHVDRVGSPVFSAVSSAASEVPARRH
jgi:hypothetical protein